MTLIPVVIATLVVNAAAVAVAVANGWPAEFGTHNDPHRVADQWIASGTAISAPLAPLVVLAVCGALVGMRSRRLGLIGAIGATCVGVLAIIGELGEPTLRHPVNTLEALFHVVGVVLGVGIILTGSREAWGRLSRTAGEPEARARLGRDRPRSDSRGSLR